MSELKPGSTIDRYHIVAFIAGGGMGQVYRAIDPRLDRTVVIKVLLPNIDQRRLEKEARAASAIGHPNIVTIYDVGELDHRPFLVMEYIEGETLDTIVGGVRPMSVAARLALVEQLCDGLTAAHEKGVCHLDIKPSNLMLDRRSLLKILDFGIARASDRTTVTSQGFEGSYGYMAPEQLTNTYPDQRADVFAATIVTYELLARAPAFPGGAATAWNRTRDTTVRSLADRVPEIGRVLDRIIERGLRIDRDKRIGSAAELKAQVSELRKEVERRESGAERSWNQITLPMPQAPGVEAGAGETDVPAAADLFADATADRPGRRWAWAVPLAGVTLALGATAWWPDTAGGPTNGPMTTQSSQPSPPTDVSATALERARTSSNRSGSGGRRSEPRPPAGVQRSGGAAAVVARDRVSLPAIPAPAPRSIPEEPHSPGPLESNPSDRPAIADRAGEPRQADSSPSSMAGVTDERSVRELIDRYLLALNQKSGARVKLVFPSITEGQLNALERDFTEADRYQASASRTPVVQIAANRAIAQFELTRRILRADGVERNLPNVATFEFGKSDGTWRITSIKLQ